MASLLALDLGTSTGWALWREGMPLVSGTLDLRPSRFEGGGMRYLRFLRWLQETSYLTPFHEVIFEEVRRHTGTDAAQIYGGFMASLTAWCEARTIPYRAIPVGTWKKILCGKGNADKAAVTAAIAARGHHVSSQDEADAIGILLGARAA